MKEKKIYILAFFILISSATVSIAAEIKCNKKGKDFINTETAKECVENKIIGKNNENNVFSFIKEHNGGKHFAKEKSYNECEKYKWKYSFFVEKDFKSEIEKATFTMCDLKGGDWQCFISGVKGCYADLENDVTGEKTLKAVIIIGNASGKVLTIYPVK